MASPETHLQQLMDDLRGRLLTMAAITREATHDAVAALMEQDRDKAAAVIDGDAALDRMEVELDDSIMQILARAQPVACDLRLLLSGIRLISDSGTHRRRSRQCGATGRAYGGFFRHGRSNVAGGSGI